MRSPAVLIIVQNLYVPLDRRVWLECLALRDAGARVRVICPRGPGDRWRRVSEAVVVYTYPPAPQARGLVGYVIEFVYCWLFTAVLSVVAKLRDGFDAIQACNPPDTYWLLARLWRPFGVRFVYDQHDLNPEVFRSRFGERRDLAGRLQLRGLLWLERMTYRSADHVISTNESYRSVATGRGCRDPGSVTVVRSGPDTRTMRPVPPVPELRRGREHLAVYLGVMGPQDGVDEALRALDVLVRERGRTDCHLALLGFGDCLDDLRQLSRDLALTDYVTFTGRVGPPEIARYLSTADLGICPDLKNPLNDVSTMNKVMEYMAYCLPSVSYDLAESRVSAGETALFVPSGDVQALATAWERLLDDPALRQRMGLAARARVVDHLDWRREAERYVGVWASVLGWVPSQVGGTAAAPPPSVDLVDLGDPEDLAAFVRDRGRPG